MPRLSSSQYLATRRSLFADWFLKIPVLSHLPYAEQLTLHEFFAFTKHLNDTEALAHRRAATAADPSLPHRAGKVMKRFDRLSTIDWEAERRKQAATGQKPSGHKVIHGLARPEPGLDRIARSIAERIVHEIEEEQDAS
ncbi:hypothetical protein [Curtobacterium sp. MCBD17_019]|uniref:hypothetical protein n=1 Tax=Curtobacterium sp. MCBD17_019 TaxID=2175669 RepID=UPI000DA8A2C6|nr:hypothetical protein [Curtobacterium sp. MCBD17_019]